MKIMIMKRIKRKTRSKMKNSRPLPGPPEALQSYS
jgi:hypothetical protein